MTILNTVGYKITNKYFNSNVFNKPEKFYALLSKDVEMVHVTGEKVYVRNGREEVYNIYLEKLFNITSEVNVVSLEIFSDGLHPQLKCVVTQTKDEDGKKINYKFIDHTKLTLAEEEEGAYKIRKIETKAEKTLNS